MRVKTIYKGDDAKIIQTLKGFEVITADRKKIFNTRYEAYLSLRRKR